MGRLIWAYAGRTYHIVGNLMAPLIYYCYHLILKLCMLMICHAFIVVCWQFSKLSFKKKIRNTIRVSDNLDPEQDRHRSWSGSKLFAKVISRWQKSPLARKELRRTLTRHSLAHILKLSSFKIVDPKKLSKHFALAKTHFQLRCAVCVLHLASHRDR